MIELGRVVEDGNKALLNRDLKYLFNTINEDNSYQDTEVIIQHLHFNPQIIFVGITFDEAFIQLERATCTRNRNYPPPPFQTFLLQTIQKPLKPQN